MTFGREKRLLLGWMALFMPLPLPLNDVLEWPVLFLYAFLVVHFIRRVENGEQRWLPNWALNLLGLAYMPILAIDLRLALQRDQAVKALLHLILFVVIAKLFSIRREKDKWQIFVSLFFLFVAAMATSSHLTIVFYLLAGLAFGFYVMARFAHLHVLARLRMEPEKPPALPRMRGSGAVAMVLMLLLAMPIFASLPRLRQPFVMGQGAGNLGLSRTTGFSDRVDLSLTTAIRGNRSIALRMKSEQPVDADDLRLKAASYDFYAENNWHRHRIESWYLDPGDNGLLFMPGGGGPALPEGTNRATVFLEPLNSRSLPAPVNTVALDVKGRVPNLRIDAGGAIVLPGRSPNQMVSYDVLLGAEPLIAGQLEGPPQMRLDALDLNGVSDRMTELASSVMGEEGSEQSRVQRLLSHLLNEYTYTLDFAGRSGATPIEDFLFTYRSGHCEYFATAMVLMLRSQGIPARLVTGFLGAEENAIEGYYLVRQGNAHAWVEAYTDTEGWQVYDPTPPEGRPGTAEPDWKLFFQQIYDYLAFRWDRYVLTYGAADQSDLFSKVRSAVVEWWNRWRAFMKDDPAATVREVPKEGVGVPSAGLESGPETTGLWQRPWVRYLGLGLFFALIAGVAAYLRSRPLTPEQAYARLRGGLEGLGLEVGATSPPLALRRLIAERHPQAASTAGEVIDLYVRASFAGEAAPGEARRALRGQVGEVLRSIGLELKGARSRGKGAATAAVGDTDGEEKKAPAQERFPAA